MSNDAYPVELHLSRTREASTREGTFDLTLVDRGRAGMLARDRQGTAFSMIWKRGRWNEWSA